MNPTKKDRYAFLKDGQIVRVAECTLMEADDLALDLKQAGIIDSWTPYENVKHLCQTSAAH